VAAGETEMSGGSLPAPGWDERAVIDVLPRAVIVTSADRRIVLWNRLAETLYGWTEAEVLGRPISDVLVPVEDRGHAEQIMAAVVAGESWSGDFTVLRRNGDPLRVFVVDAPLLDADGAVLAIVGASEDVTDQRMLEQEAADLAAHLVLALDAGELGTWRWDMSTGETTWDARLEALHGLQPGTFAGTFEAYVSFLHPDDAPAVLETVRRAVEDKGRYTVEHRVVWPDGSVHWVQGKGQVTVDEFGTVTGTMGCVADVTVQAQATAERERALVAAREAAERERVSALRLAFLGRINDALAASASRADVMRNVTRAAVPMLGDWCAIHVLPDVDATIPEMEIAHADPAKVEYIRAFQERFPFDPNASTGIPLVIRTGESQFYPHIDEQVLAQADTTDEARAIVRSLGLRSAIAVPLAKSGRVIGALQFVNSDTSRRYTSEDLALAKAVASRIASTLENRRLAEQQRVIATTLQASLLPETLPTIPALEVAVRYWAAGEGTTVGGDFYDVFEVDDHWAVVIGDVCGRGPAAASLTGLARHTIRAAAWNHAEPDDVLRQLNHAIRRSGRQTFCTALYCTLMPTTAGFRFTVAAGGHPLPIVHRADGTSETFGEPGTLLGVTVDSRSTTVSKELLPGDTVMLYTDGITDVRPPHGLTPEDMEDMVDRAASSDAGAEIIASALGLAIDRHLSFADRNDDIAMLVLKVEPKPATQA
jgi:PAS domain S-box-containing protein